MTSATGPQEPMSSEPIVVTREGGVATVTLNRPERKNALAGEHWMLLGDILEDLAVDADIRVVVLTGAQGNFCSGADLSSGALPHPVERMRRVNRAAELLGSFDKPTIAAVEGYATGAGWNMALLCDFVIASSTARFSQIFARRGLSVDFGGSWILPRLVGLHTAKRLVMLAEMIDAAEADRLGLVSMLVEPDDLESTTADVAGRLAQGPPVALALSGRLLEAGSSSGLRDALDREAAAQPINFASDSPGAIAAFREKRTARFDGVWLPDTGSVGDHTDSVR